MNGNVYISLVERFSELVLYDAKGVSPNTSNEMRRIMSRFSASNSRACATLAGGFEAFRLAFPFVCTQSDVRSAVDREKFLTIYPSVIVDNQLYLGKVTLEMFSKGNYSFYVQARVTKRQIGRSFVILKSPTSSTSPSNINVYSMIKLNIFIWN